MVDEERGLKAEYRGNCTPSRMALPLVFQIVIVLLFKVFRQTAGRWRMQISTTLKHRRSEEFRMMRAYGLTASRSGLHDDTDPPVVSAHRFADGNAN